MTELKAYQVDEFLSKKSIKSGVYLVYGPDAGLVRERGVLLSTIATDHGSTNSANQSDFADNVIVLQMEELETNPSRLAIEALTQSMFGGAPVIRVRGASKNLSPLLSDLLEKTCEAIIVVEAGNLTKRDKLRVLIEENPQGTTLPCFADDIKSLKILVQHVMKRENIAISSEAVDYLSSVLGNDREITRRELEKLVNFALENKELELVDVERLCGDNSMLALDRITDAIGMGNPESLETALCHAYDAGLDSQVLLGVSARHFQFLRTVRAKIDAGSNPVSALSNTYPRPHFSRKQAIEIQVQKWKSPSIARASKRIFETTLLSRQNAALSETLTRRALLGLCLAASNY